MSTLKSVVMVVMFLSVPLAGCLDNSSGDDGDHSVDVSELEERIDQLNSTLNELNESIIFLKNGWSDANITILELGQNLSQSDAVIASMLQGWDASNQTILELRQAWDQSNNSQSETIPIAPPGMNQTLLELQNQIDQANEEITYLKNGWASANNTISELATGWVNANETMIFLRHGWANANQTIQSLTYEWHMANYSALIPETVPQYRGSWTNPIHSSDTSRSNLFSCGSDSGWKSADAEKTVEILEQTGQNLYMMGAQRIEDSVGSNCNWYNIEKLVSEIDDSDSHIETMTVMPDYYNTTEYIGIIEESRNLSTNYSNLVAVTVDDFNQALVSPNDLTNSNGITKTDVEQMYHHAHQTTNSNASEIDFMPYFSGSELPLYYITDTLIFGTAGCGDECILADGSEGMDGDFYIFPEDELVLNATFQTPYEYAGYQTQISFMISENLRYAPYTMDIVFEINGMVIGTYAMVDSPQGGSVMSVINFTMPILNAGEQNTFGMRIDTNGTTVTKYQNKLAYLWNFKIGDVENSNFFLPMTNVTKIANRGVVPNRPVYSLDSFFASSNDEWRITNFTDGVLFKYPSRVQHLDVETHERFVRSVCVVSNQRYEPCIEVYWGNDQWTSDVIGSRANPGFDVYMESSVEYTDGIVFWMLDLNLYDRSLGKLSLRDVKNTNMQTAIGFAAETSPSPGYYHQWNYVIKVSGNYSISFNTQTNLPDATLYHTIAIDGARVYDLDCADSGNSGTYTLNLSKNDKLQIRAELVDGYSGNYYYSEWNISSDAVELDIFDLHHTSGVSSNTEYMFDVIIQYLQHWASFDPPSPV